MSDDREPASVGVESIDVEHRHIVRRVRGLSSAVEQGRPEEVRAALRLLGAALEAHWRDEEAWMAEQGYPAAGEHGRVHGGLLARLAEVRRISAEEGRAAVAAAAALELAREVEGHMRTADLKLGRFYAARENFRVLADAKAGKGPALTPIPGALAALGPLVPAARAGTPRPEDGTPLASLTPAPRLTPVPRPAPAVAPPAPGSGSAGKKPPDRR